MNMGGERVPARETRRAQVTSVLSRHSNDQLFPWSDYILPDFGEGRLCRTPPAEVAAGQGERLQEMPDRENGRDPTVGCGAGREHGHDLTTGIRQYLTPISASIPGSIRKLPNKRGGLWQLTEGQVAS